jgi:hypothetical protein
MFKGIAWNEARDVGLRIKESLASRMDAAEGNTISDLSLCRIYLDLCHLERPGLYQILSTCSGDRVSTYLCLS